MFLEEQLIVCIAECRTQQRQVLLADNEASTMLQQFGQQSSCTMQLTGILACLVVAEETADNHSAESVLVLVCHNLKVAHQVVGEVVLCHLVEQLILID